MNTKKSLNDQESRFYTRFNPPPQEGVSFSHTDSMTFQSFKDDCDINVIMKRFREKGVCSHLMNGQPSYGDFSTNPTDLTEAYELVENAQSMFSSLPSHIRDRFDHDPVKFFDFYSNDNNNEELVKMGLKVSIPFPSDPLPATDSKAELVPPLPEK